MKSNISNINVSKQEIIALLTQDGYYRKLQRWPLLTSKDIFPLTFRHRIDDTFYFMRAQYYPEIKMGNTHPDSHPSEMENFIIFYDMEYPYVSNLLKKFKGHLITCGGSVSKGVYNNISDDVDLFFYDLTIDDANKLRIEAIHFLVSNWEHNTVHPLRYWISRNEYTTTLYITEHKNDDMFLNRIFKYQFIHRIYPDISLIIGGFDLSSCMIAYDGEELYATPLGVWSIKHKLIIIDTKRRSTSFEHRLEKYFRFGFGIIFPGIKRETIDNVFEHDTVKNCVNDIIIDGEENHICGDQCYHFCLIKEQKQRKFYSKQNSVVRTIQSEENILPYMQFYKGRYGNDLNFHKVKHYNKNVIEDQYIDTISDYKDINMHPDFLKLINAQHLRSDKLYSVCSIFENINSDVSKLQDILIHETDNPNFSLEYCVDYYKNLVEMVKIPFRARTNAHYNINPYYNTKEYNSYHDFYRLMKCFGKLTPDVIKIRDTDKYSEYRDIMIDKMIINAEKCKEILKGIKWITQNPERQWTSSINPIIADPREWYGKYYIPVVTGIPNNVETTLRLMRLPKTESIWVNIDDDVFSIICSHLLKLYADDAWCYI
jgi:hypothetical protein